MQISRCVLIACVSAAFLSFPALRAADTEAQIKAREALERILNQAQPSGTAPARAPQVTPTPAPVVPPPASIQRATQMPPSLGAPTPSTPEQIEKAREALRQQMMQGQPSTPATRVTPAPAIAPVTPQPRPAPAPVAQPTPIRRPTPLAAPTASKPEDVEKAREALRQAMQGTAPTGSAPTTAPRPVPPAAQPAAPVWAAPTASTPGSVEKAQEALRQKMRELESQPATTAPDMQRQRVQPLRPADPAVAQPSVPEPEFAPLPAAADPQVVEKAREALRNMMAARPTPPVETPRAARPARPVRPAEGESVKPLPPAKATVTPKSPTEFQTLQGPPTGLSASQEQRLKELLEQYKADQLTPNEYHSQRTKILAEP